MDVLSTFQRSDEYSMVFSIFSQKVGATKAEKHTCSEGLVGIN